MVVLDHYIMKRFRAEKNNNMEENLGSLGNVEIYFVLKYYDEEYIKGLLTLLPPVPIQRSYK
jgi:hypothetical protein